ncbi:unnamed protein product [Periconia digitata]|uniref:Uncharacterized protein n=1 Tax=Periconia digitata TaxID=1303443 RepID=A0A9W4U4X6_9PLEO|nr:unnamed protein product [Periconia digitata]
MQNNHASKKVKTHDRAGNSHATTVGQRMAQNSLKSNLRFNVTPPNQLHALHATHNSPVSARLPLNPATLLHGA